MQQGRKSAKNLGKGEAVKTRTYKLKMGDMGISRWAYEELRAFCRQYPEKKAQASALLGVQGGSKVQTARDDRGREVGVVMPSSGRKSSPTESAAEKRAVLLADVEMIDKIASEVGGGIWHRALILNCCYGLSHECISQAILPTANRNAYFAARREFFFRLYGARGGKV